MREPLVRTNAERILGGLQPVPVVESIAEETPIAFLYNGRPYAVMMATPRDLVEFAFGFSVTEGIVDTASQIELVDQLQTENGVSMEMLIPQRYYDGMSDRQRNLTGRTGCGLCGAESLAEAIRPIRVIWKATIRSAEDIAAAFDRLQNSQPLNDNCGGLHAAAVLTEQGGMIVREDVGRHNAVDKAIGAALLQRQVPEVLLATSRASYEVVHKAAQVGCSLVATISAPTALAIRLAQEAGITLVGFARQGRMTVYSGRLQTTRFRAQAVLT